MRSATLGLVLALAAGCASADCPPGLGYEAARRAAQDCAREAALAAPGQSREQAARRETCLRAKGFGPPLPGLRP